MLDHPLSRPNKGTRKTGLKQSSQYKRRRIRSQKASDINCKYRQMTSAFSRHQLFSCMIKCFYNVIMQLFLIKADAQPILKNSYLEFLC